jgi:hypothetical protein
VPVLWISRPLQNKASDSEESEKRIVQSVTDSPLSVEILEKHLFVS